MIWYILCHTTGSGSQPAAGIGRPAPPLTTREGTAPPGILAGRALGSRRASMHCPLVTLPFRGQSPPRRKPSTISLHAGNSHLPSRLLQLQGALFPAEAPQWKLPGCCCCHQPVAGHVVAVGHLIRVSLPSPPLKPSMVACVGCHSCGSGLRFDSHLHATHENATWVNSYRGTLI